MLLKLNFFTLISAILLSLSSITFSKVENDNIIHKKIILKANKNQVWSALTSHTELSKWWNKGVKLEPLVGGVFYEPWGKDQLATGIVKSLKAHDYIEFTWKEKYWNPSEITTCIFKIKENGDHTILEVAHSGWDTFHPIEHRRNMVKGFYKGWDMVLSKLQRHFEKRN